MALKAQLLPLGYTAEIGESLQIRRIGESIRHPRADILIRDVDASKHQASKTEPTGAQTIALEAFLDEAEDHEHPYHAVAIYERSPEAVGEAVGWVELLSPSNKIGINAQSYHEKRRELLRLNLVFIEIDYLHETPPTFSRLPDYTRGEAAARPFRIVVIDPRPSFHDGRISSMSSMSIQSFRRLLFR